MVRALIVLAVVAAARPAVADPSDRDLFYLGLALAPPTYLVGVSLHEGSHALMGTLVGGTIEKVHLFPPARDPRSGKFRFGWVYARGLRTKTQKQLFYAAPKITDAVLLGGFSALVLTDAWPSNRYGQLALTVFATGLFIDFAKDIFLFSPANDTVKMFNLWCMTGWKQLPARLIYAAAIVGAGYVVWRGYERTFSETFGDSTTTPTPFVVPVVTSAF